jgi:hypothetical protein
MTCLLRPPPPALVYIRGEKAILNALHDYGRYLEDAVGGASSVSGVAFKAQPDEHLYAHGPADPFAALSGRGWTATTVAGPLTLRCIGADHWNPPGPNLHRAHALVPCMQGARLVLSSLP